MILELKGIYKDYQQGKMIVPVLKDVNFSMEEGEYVAIYDMSGNQVAIARGCDGATTIDCTGLAKGIYLVSANAGSARFAR